MFPQIQFHHDALSFHSINQFLHRCSQTKNLRAIQKSHGHLLRAGLFFIFPNLQTKLIFTYSAYLNGINLKTLTYFCKCLKRRNPLPFNSIVPHFSQDGFNCLAFHTLSFRHYNTIYIDSYAFCSALKSASCFKNVFFGKSMCGYIEMSGWLACVFVGSTSVDFYANLLHVEDAAMAFGEIPHKITVYINALLSGYAEAKMWNQGIKLVKRMPQLGLQVDNFTLSAALHASLKSELIRKLIGCLVPRLHQNLTRRLLTRDFYSCLVTSKAIMFGEYAWTYIERSS